MGKIGIEAARIAIIVERQRQIEAEGYDSTHDDAHNDGSILRAAVIYYQHGARKGMPLQMRADGAPMGWPWDAEWWKPKDARRDLERAGALALAERDRLRRARLNVQPAMQKFEIIVAALAALPMAES